VPPRLSASRRSHWRHHSKSSANATAPTTALHNRGDVAMEDPDDFLMAEANGDIINGNDSIHGNGNGNGNSNSNSNTPTPTPPPNKKPKTSFTEVVPAPPSFLTGKEGVCRIEVARVEWITTAPWQRTAQTKGSGTGFCIKGNLLLTNAHVVKSAVDIRVRKHGSTQRWPARVAVYAPDVDLALLELTGNSDEEIKSFFVGSDGTSDLALDFASQLPSLQEGIHVVGTFLQLQQIMY